MVGALQDKSRVWILWQAGVHFLQGGMNGLCWMECLDYSARRIESYNAAKQAINECHNGILGHRKNSSLGVLRL